MGLLSKARELLDAASGGTSSAERELERMELEQARALASEAERGEAMAHDQAAIGPKLRRRYHFVGQVQGVGFRWTTTNLANSAGATGWVMNEPDGSVTAEIQGISEQVVAVINGLERYYNGRRWVGGFTIDDVRDVPVIKGEADFHPVY